ncbi:MAG: RecX family transcriptional regulator [Alphaproteobacteria bacterium]|nr:RecX family transcriptional regulator [Alphaproteobacteria bacterium]
MTRPRRPFRKPTPERLANAALFYLGRYAASEASLRRVLDNKIRRACLVDAAFAADHAAQEVLRKAIEEIIATHRRTGVLNDAAYAEMKVHSLRRSGKSARLITQKLAQKGVGAAHIEAALVLEEGEEPREADLAAAQALAKKRGLGPYRRACAAGQAGDREKERKRAVREVSTLARAGFPFDIIREVLGAEAAESVEDESLTA